MYYNLAPKTIVITVDAIKNTNAFAVLTTAQKLLTRRWNNIKAIDNNVKVAQNIGLETWLGQTGANPINREIVKELLNN